MSYEVTEERLLKAGRLLREVADLLEEPEACGSVALGYIRDWCSRAVMDLNFYRRGIAHFRAEKEGEK